MKKQYQLVIVILVTTLFFCTNQKNNLKACGTNATACATIQIKEIKKTAVIKKDNPGGAAYTEHAEGGLYRYMNPFTQ